MLKTIKLLKNKYFRKVNKEKFLFYLIIFPALIVRIINLNYNTPFNDEAIYVVVGKMGLFANDWWSYGARLWMAGLPYLYPSLTAMAYQVGGIIGSRLLNVFFGVFLVEEVYRFTRMLNIFNSKKYNLPAALIASFIVAFSYVGIFVSKLATYDIPTYFLMLFSINSFIKANYFNNGKYYFLAAVSLLAAFLMKIVTALFFPVLFILSVIEIRKRNNFHKKLWYLYGLVPFVLGILFYALFFGRDILIYASSQTTRDSDFLQSIIHVIWENSYVTLIMSCISLYILLLIRRVKSVLGLLALALIIPIFHISLMRYPTLNKHIYLTIIFLSPIIGYTFAYLMDSKNKIIAFVIRLSVLVLAIIYLAILPKNLYRLEHDWINTANLKKFLSTNVQMGDKVLAETGADVVLSLYNKTYPPGNIFTLDWIEYSGMSDDTAYIQAIRDKYFDYIELDNKNEAKKELAMKILTEIDGRYKLIYEEGFFKVYSRSRENSER
ncbi:hypothetical protein A3A76_02900 [Candidatus Woesebacteria bacterium RIFCSPLOWO2_01_FULL_39_23]|uniref:Glycosyltransferase RgtA/B/C/D-like domain-containing protein n=1 Tax=Candidatus Woesebacteria bacterium RIFCSPHIGHO2_01_FULL_40_22 TaxID=1802499 RepID=A0A1F7YJ98_9BACT|nr:MAG: hypothetical protein A2141_01120 [Candidatus Woesebacteria bacterium RBG_16_40_11]OGM27421.1 MAG: hypothetical protein A2628_01305 [Candidatus Woesebacteria bacterium RIFCSPHIGHO2_01_FULL_40_22]OGM36183.1 MAG: hypothetical protein A3E41_01590 [Candidatus Woesebacteria bacterium RIFCSPHIGHO2_12_FULL_38_9]OGM62593.1 MAG: hypothetical protein A3A76_02900 [Candidatus Woesebacteria bacterium RIFCSPLOWO2_01_FULL_39_23]